MDETETSIDINTEIKEKEPINSVEQISREYNCIFVHGLVKKAKKNRSGGNNLVVQKEQDWQDSLKIISLLSPTIPCSTVRLGDSRDAHIFGDGFGVLLSGGTIEEAKGVSGGATVATDIDKRSGGLWNPPDLHAQLERSVNKQYTNVNELIVAKPKLAGFFIENKEEFKDQKSLRVPQGFEELNQNFQLPVYILEDTKIYEGVYKVPVFNDQDELLGYLDLSPAEVKTFGWQKVREIYPESSYAHMTYEKGKELSVDDILASQYTLPPAKKEEIVQQFTEDNPFYEHIDWQKHIAE